MLRLLHCSITEEAQPNNCMTKRSTCSHWVMHILNICIDIISIVKSSSDANDLLDWSEEEGAGANTSPTTCSFWSTEFPEVSAFIFTVNLNEKKINDHYTKEPLSDKLGSKTPTVSQRNRSSGFPSLPWTTTPAARPLPQLTAYLGVPFLTAPWWSQMAECCGDLKGQLPKKNAELLNPLHVWEMVLHWSQSRRGNVIPDTEQGVLPEVPEHKWGAFVITDPTGRLFSATVRLWHS